MTEPTTPTGKRLVPDPHGGYYRRNKDNTITPLSSHSEADILAIEQEARAMERERLRDKAEGIAAPGSPVSPEWRRVLDRLLADPEPGR